MDEHEGWFNGRTSPLYHDVSCISMISMSGGFNLEDSQRCDQKDGLADRCGVSVSEGGALAMGQDWDAQRRNLRGKPLHHNVNRCKPLTGLLHSCSSGYRTV